MLSIEELHVRAALFRAVREYFHINGFLEVDTPIRQPVVLPESNIEPLASEGWLLQASPELCMKRLLASGCTKIFQICRCFRKNERGRLHLEEFTMLEWYRMESDYTALMTDCEALVGHLLQALTPFAGGDAHCIDTLTAAPKPWRRTSVEEAFARYSPVGLRDAIEEDRFDDVLVEHVEPHLGRSGPEFLFDYPAGMASLARRKRDDSALAERFELYIDGVELANGFSELTDAGEQRARFESELEQIEAKGGWTGGMPERFLADLEFLGECAGIAFGVDRLLMLLRGKKSIGAVVAFQPDDF